MDGPISLLHRPNFVAKRTQIWRGQDRAGGGVGGGGKRVGRSDDMGCGGCASVNGGGAVIDGGDGIIGLALKPLNDIGQVLAVYLRMVIPSSDKCR